MARDDQMRHLDMIVEADKDGMLRLEIPVDEPNISYHVVVQVEPKPPSEWPPDFFEKTAGQWVGDLERPEQGDYEEREPF
jgi:hypothetical protein